MSHIVEIDMQINDLDALAATAKALGMEFIKGQKQYKWYGRSVGDYPLPEGFKAEDLGKCEHALRVKGSPGAYEIGVIKRRDGKPGYTLLWDFWNGGKDYNTSGKGLEACVGKNAGRLKQEYALQCATKEARKQGLRVTRQVKGDGRVILRAS